MIAHILVPLDTTPGAERALLTAVTIAAARDADLHLVLVRPTRRRASEAEERGTDRYHEYHDGRTQQLAEELRRNHAVTVTTSLRRGDPTTVLAMYAASRAIDLIVMSSHGYTGLRRAWLGSVADELVHVTHVPLMIVRRSSEANPPQMQRILVAMEDAVRGRDAAELALQTFDGRGVVIILMHVVMPVLMQVDLQFASGLAVANEDATGALAMAAREELLRLADALRPGRRATIETLVEIAPAVFPVPPVAGTIAEVTRRERADLLVLTTHGRRWTRLFTSSVADRVLDESGCSILLTHPATATAVAEADEGAQLLPAGIVI